MMIWFDLLIWGSGGRLDWVGLYEVKFWFKSLSLDNPIWRMPVNNKVSGLKINNILTPIRDFDIKKHLILAVITTVTAILLFILGLVINSLLLELTVIIVGGKLATFRPTEPIQIMISTGILFASCALWAMILYLVYSSTKSASFSITRYFIFLAISIINVLVGIGLRLVYLASIPLETVGMLLGALQFLKWGLIVNLLVCGAIIVFFVISRSGQSRLSEKEA